MITPRPREDHEAEFDDATNPYLLAQQLGIAIGPPAWPLRLPWTYERYSAIPDDGYRYEVIKGVLYAVAAPHKSHQAAVLRLSRVLDEFVEGHDLGRVLTAPTSVCLAVETTVQPDVLYVRRDRMGIIGDYVAGAPDLIVEVLSPETAARDRSEKAAVYAEYGVPHYWIGAPLTKSLEVYELHDGVYLLAGRYTGNDTFEPGLFPGLTISIAALWR